jgi:hypothetical protein
MTSRRRSPALPIAIAALLLASAGTAIGAGHYLITSAGQIKPGAISLRDLSPAAIAKLRAAHTVVKTSGTIPANSPGSSVRASCPRGQQATGGGFGNDGPVVLESRPDPETGTPTAWSVTASNLTVPPVDQTQTVYVVCAR